MSEEQTKEATTEQSGEKSIAIPVSQYNELTGKITKYETDLAHLQHKLQLRDEAPKPNNDKGQGNSELEELKKQLDNAVSEKDKYAQIAKQRIAVDEIFSKISSKFPESTHYFLKQEIAREVDIEGELDKPRIIVKGTNGQPQWSKQKQNEHMGPEEYASELLTRHASLSIPHNRGGHKENGTPSSPSSKGGDNYESLTMADIGQMTEADVRAIPPAVLKKILKTHGI